MKGKTGYRTGSINGLTGVIGLPEGCARRSLRLLLDRMVSLYIMWIVLAMESTTGVKKESKPLATKAMGHGTTKESC